MPHSVITVAQQKGGAGKTTIAANLAINLAQKGFDVAILDIDPQGSLTAWYGARKEYASEGDTQIRFRAVNDSRGLKKDIDALRSEHDFVIIDCPPHTHSEAREAVKEADLVIVPMQPSPTDIWATVNILELALKENMYTYLLLNRVIPNTKLTKHVLKSLPPSRIQSTIGNRVAFPNAMSRGKAVTEAEPSGKAAREIETLTNEIVNLIAEQAQEETQQRMAG